MSGAVRFVLDGEIIELADPDPTRTVLQFLREDLRRIGTKEGCAEGDCGACTVAIAEVARDGGGLEVRAFNACIQFLPTLDGKELITVESLKSADGSLHPVQQAMVECHGSQCGFCTPGFVMSLFALYKNNPQPSRREIDDALAGNLCRCTGYRPIVSAARAMYQAPADGASWLRTPHGVAADGDANARVARLRALDRGGSLAIERDGRRFFAPRSLPEMAELVGAHPDATILAGGTDVGLWVTKQLRELETIIYSGRVAELRALQLCDDHLEIGAAVTLSEAMPQILAHWPGLDELFLRFASPPIRNAGTLGGNVANGSPIGDSMPALLALDAAVVLQKGDARRELPLVDFYVDYRKTMLERGEFLVSVRVPLPRAGSRVSGYKISKRFDQDISAVCGAFRLELDGDSVALVRLGFGGLAATPKRARQAERTLTGQPWNENSVRRAAEALGRDFQPISDMRASADYRLTIARNLLTRFLLETRGEPETRVYDYGRQKLA